jgi:hypothetical protein
MKRIDMKRLMLFALGFISIATVGFSAGTPRNNPAPAYTVSKLPLAAGAAFLMPLQINNRGEILGGMHFSSGPFAFNAHLALVSGGTTIDLHLPIFGAGTPENSVPVGLNDHGQIIFFAYTDLPGGPHFFLYDHGQLVDLNAYYGSDDLDFLATVSGKTNFLYAGGQLRLFDTGAADNAVPAPFLVKGINHRGDAVGSSLPFSTDSHALLFSGGRTYDLNDLIDPASGWRLIWAFDINDHGQIIGWGRVDGHEASFLLDPIRPPR